MNATLQTSNAAAMTSYDRFHLSAAERRIRNRSLCSLLCTPPPYPGYAAKLDKLCKSSFYQQSCQSTVSELATSSNPTPSNSTTNVDLHFSSTGNVINATCPFKHEISAQLQSAENDDVSWKTRKKHTNSKESSGYGSETESDPENEQQAKKNLEAISACQNITSTIINGHLPSTETAMNDSTGKYNAETVVRATTRTPTRQQHNPQQQTSEKNRRRSVPANLRNTFTDEIVRVLEINGVFQCETDADTGVRRPIVCEQSVNRPESVMQLARKFAEASAAQDKQIYISNQKLLKNGHNIATVAASSHPAQKGIHQSSRLLDTFNRKPGGIACLFNDTMSKVNVFKQMEQVHQTGQAQTVRLFSQSTIKNALLRWCQVKLENYPVQITNFSSCWADGIAFCALIHRFAPNSFDFNKLDSQNRRENFELAFRVAEENGIVPLLEVDDMLLMGDRPDWKCIFTYVQSFYKAFKDHL